MLKAVLAVSVHAVAAPISLQSPEMSEITAFADLTNPETQFPEPADSTFANELMLAPAIVTTLPATVQSIETGRNDRMPEAPTALSAATIFLTVGVVGLRRRILLERRRPERRRRKTAWQLMA